MPTKKDSSEISHIPASSPDIRKEILQKIREIYPALFGEGNTLNAKELQALVDEYSKPEVERYAFPWTGKTASKRFAFTPSKARLVPDKERSIDFDTTQNLIIEGENLEVLKLLQSSYFKKVKMIYIDPPYNTGHDFVYPDDYSESKESYWEKGGVMQEGVRIDTNSESSGRYHSNWLSMMQSRLLLARNLLRDDGVIFVSIDDNEVHNLRKLMDEIFGEENFIAQLVWSGGRKNDSRFISISHEYVVCYVKSAIDLIENDVTWRQRKKGLEDIYSIYEKLKKKFKNDYSSIEQGLSDWYAGLDNTNPAKNHSHYSHVDERGIYFAADISWPGGGGPKYEVLHPVTHKPCSVPSRGWMFSDPKKMTEVIKDNRVHFGPDENSVPCIKSYLKDREAQVPYSVFYQDGRAATKRLRELLGGDLFDHPKDENVLKDIVEFCTKGDDLVLDFFAGSGTTAHSVMELNKQDGGNRKFILVQLPEATDEKSEAFKAGYKTISQITIERVKRAGAKIKAEKPEVDTGFKVLRLAKSLFPQNMFEVDPEMTEEEKVKAWETYLEKSKQAHLFDFKPDELLTEIALKDGFDLNFKTEPLKEFKKNKVFNVTDGERTALICLDENLQDETIKSLGAFKERRFICLERSVDSTRKWNLKRMFGDNLWVA